MEVLTSVLILLAGCGVFMTGMKMMGDGLERSAGKGMKKLFGKISSNRFAGIGVGAAVTAIIQSSSATTVMVIGFVNAGLMTLFQATSIIMGANIGTTITGVLVSFSALPINYFAMAFTFVGIFMVMLTRSDTVKRIGGIISGLGMIFVGLYLMSSGFKSSETLNKAFEQLFQKIDFPLLLILFGMMFTAVVQSSSAATGLIITMVGQNILDMRLALFIVLGTNIGTCITAIIASIGASTNAKRAALIHLTFNVIGTVIFTAILWIFSAPIVGILEKIIQVPQMQIAWFHVSFNILTTLMLMPFIKLLTQFATFIIKDKKTDVGGNKFYYIDDRFLMTPPIAVAQVVKEVVNMSSIAKENLDKSMNAVFTGSIADKEKILAAEESINYINKGVATYLIKISSLALSKSDEKLVGSLHHVISDIERIGDHAENFLEESEEMQSGHIVLSDDAIDELKGMYARVRELFALSLTAFETRNLSMLSKISEIEAEVDTLKKVLGNSHIMRLNAGTCNVESGTHFYAIISALERVADHLTNVAFSIKSPSGSQREAMEKIFKETLDKKHKDTVKKQGRKVGAKKDGDKDEKSDKK